jgi:hypothetical protein
MIYDRTITVESTTTDAPTNKEHMLRLGKALWNVVKSLVELSLYVILVVLFMHGEYPRATIVMLLLINNSLVRLVDFAEKGRTVTVNINR